MNGKELMILAAGVFLTIVAWMIIDLYHINEQEYINREIPPVEIPNFKINTSIFPTLSERNP
jgi:hypothetical protein